MEQDGTFPLYMASEAGDTFFVSLLLCGGAAVDKAVNVSRFLCCSVVLLLILNCPSNMFAFFPGI